MGAIVQNLYQVGARWKFRKVIPSRLRPHLDKNLTEYVRWLGPGAGQQPPPEVLHRYAAAEAECANLIALAEKRAAGRFDDISAEAVAHVIAQARHELLEEDEEDRFDRAEDGLFASVKEQLVGTGAAANPSDDRRWEKRQESLADSLAVWRHEHARGEVSAFVMDEVQDRCAAHGLNVDTASLGFRRLTKAYLGLLIEVAEAGLRRQAGEVLPTPEPPPVTPSSDLKSVPDQTITGLVVDWWGEAEPAGRSLSTYDAYKRAARQLSAFLGHDDANAVTSDDIIRFKDHRLAQGTSPRTIKFGDLSALSSLYTWAKSNNRVRTIPTEGVKVISQKKARGRDPAFTDEEARIILRHALNHQGGENELAATVAAKRWVPWLCAYTGARVGEMVQLRGQDLRKEGDYWVLTITPEAGTVKAKKFREVPLHPHLVDMGFPDFAAAAGKGFLFMHVVKPGKLGERGAWQTMKNRIREFVREVVTDERVQPSHGWRHRVEKQARTLNVREDTTFSVTGREFRGSAKEYPSTSLEAKAGFVFQLPRYPTT